jgi:gliding motility-associated-like protein
MSTVASGFIDSWKWDFGENNILTDISTEKNPSFTYLSEGTKTARMIVTTSEGCRDTVTRTISIVHKPPVNLAFRDTLICTGDQLQLSASGAGNFTWSPAAGISNPGALNPFVAPATTTKYYVDLNIDGCSNRDSVLVRVTDHVTLEVMQDTTICSNDTIRLRVNSDGLRFLWTPANQLDNATVMEPLAYTAGNTEYEVTAYIGGCAATKNIFVNTVPYPVVHAGNDTVICFNTTAQLHAVTDGGNWTWSPASSLSNHTILNPIVTPTSTSAYVFNATGLTGCPKPVSDTVMVTVLAKINPQAGNDTSVVIGQPLQLVAAGGDVYQWSPSFALSATGVANPIAIFSEPSDGIRYKVQVFNSAGCVDSAFVFVKVFATLPAVFVPTGFTPNNDGINDVLRPVIAGMKQLNYFQVFNRWGQLVFSTSRSGEGWDGRVRGEVQANNVYVWMVKAVDYNGNPYFKRGTVTLVR